MRCASQMHSTNLLVDGAIRWAILGLKMPGLILFILFFLSQSTPACCVLVYLAVCVRMGDPFCPLVFCCFCVPTLPPAVSLVQQAPLTLSGRKGEGTTCSPRCVMRLTHPATKGETRSDELSINGAKQLDPSETRWRGMRRRHHSTHKSSDFLFGSIRNGHNTEKKKNLCHLAVENESEHCN